VAGEFQTTNWTVVLAARDEDSSIARAALTELCETYWFPVYTFIRRLGHGADESADLTQGYFLALLEKDYLDEVRPEAGRFRSFLLVSTLHFVSNERVRARAAERGGKAAPVSLDAAAAEDRYRLEIADGDTPESVFERQWAMTVLERSLAALGAEMGQAGHADRFERLRPELTGEQPSEKYESIARDLGMTEPAVRAAVHRMRKRFGEHLRAEVSRTVAREEDVDLEIRHLLSSL